MDNLGKLLDQYSIEKIRENKYREANKDSRAIREKANGLLGEVQDYISDAIQGNVTLPEPTYKFYKGENLHPIELIDLATAVSTLFDANINLWETEDKRRDLKLSDKVRLNAADEISTYNRIRNDAIDQVNKKFLYLLQ